MFKSKIGYSIFLLFLLTLSGCQLIGDIFKAGVWTGILLVIALVGLVIYLISKMGKKG
jgi:cytosine/uracil/thiamine/allantoin permease